MQCKVCNLHFNQLERCPRILLNCGHTTCQACIIKMLSSTLNACPFCSTPVNARTIDEFPKNLILIGKAAPNSNNVCCPLHDKCLEAFCDNDKSLLCIDCILCGDHKVHNVMPCELAFQKEKQVMITKSLECQQAEVKVKQILDSYAQHQSMLKEKASESKESISLFYMEVKNLIRERENSLKQNIDTILERELKDISQYSAEIENFISVIKKFNDEVCLQNKENMIQTLRNSSGRHQLIKKLSEMPHEHNKTIQFPEITKVIEITHLSDLVIRPHSKNGSVSAKH
jgi:tripartite motif-containing protein 43/48/49/64/77